MRRHDNQSVTPPPQPTEDDLSSVFSEVNQSYIGKPKQLIPNYSSDGRIYIIVFSSTSTSAKSVTLLVCDRNQILKTHNFSFWHNVPLLNRCAAIDGRICIPDSSANNAYKLREFVYDPVNMTITESSISSGNNYVAPLGACYTDTNGHHHFIVTYNSTYNCLGDYDLTARTYTRSNTSPHRYNHLLTNNYLGVQNQKCFICGEHSNSRYYTLSLGSQYNAGVNQANFSALSPIYNSSKNDNQFVVAMRFNNSELYRVFMLTSVSTWTSYSCRELTFNDSMTTITALDTMTPPCYFPAFPPLYVNDSLTKYWSLEYGTFDIKLFG